MPSYTSTPCLTSRHRSCSDLACRCLCHDRKDGTKGRLTSPVTAQPSFFRKLDAEQARRRLERQGVVLPQEGQIAEVKYHCGDCGKEMTKKQGGGVFQTCDECFEKNHYASPEERQARRQLLR